MAEEPSTLTEEDRVHPQDGPHSADDVALDHLRVAGFIAFLKEQEQKHAENGYASTGSHEENTYDLISALAAAGLIANTATGRNPGDPEDSEEHKKRNYEAQLMDWFNQQIRAIDFAIEQLEFEIARDKAVAERLEAQIATMKSENAALKAEVAMLENKNDQIRTRIKEIDQTLDSSQTPEKPVSEEKPDWMLKREERVENLKLAEEALKEFDTFSVDMDIETEEAFAQLDELLPDDVVKIRKMATESDSGVFAMDVAVGFDKENNQYYYEMPAGTRHTITNPEDLEKIENQLADTANPKFTADQASGQALEQIIEHQNQAPDFIQLAKDADNVYDAYKVAKAEVETQKKEMDEEQNKVGGLSKDIRDIDKKISALEREKLLAEKLALQAELAANEGKISSNNKKILSNNEAIPKAEAELAKIRAQIVEHEQQLAKLNADRAALVAEKQKLGQHLDEDSKELVTQMSALNKANDSYTAIKDQIDKVVDKMEKAAQQYESANETLKMNGVMLVTRDFKNAQVELPVHQDNDGYYFIDPTNNKRMTLSPNEIKSQLDAGGLTIEDSSCTTVTGDVLSAEIAAKSVIDAADTLAALPPEEVEAAHASAGISSKLASVMTSRSMIAPPTEEQARLDQAVVGLETALKQTVPAAQLDDAVKKIEEALSGKDLSAQDLEKATRFASPEMKNKIQEVLRERELLEKSDPAHTQPSGIFLFRDIESQVHTITPLNTAGVETGLKNENFVVTATDVGDPLRPTMTSEGTFADAANPPASDSSAPVAGAIVATNPQTSIPLIMASNSR